MAENKQPDGRTKRLNLTIGPKIEVLLFLHNIVLELYFDIKHWLICSRIRERDKKKRGILCWRQLKFGSKHKEIESKLPFLLSKSIKNWIETGFS